MKQARKKTGVGVAPKAIPAPKSSAVSIATAANAGDQELLVSSACTEPSIHTPTSAVASPRAAQAHTYELSPSCTVRDSIALKIALLDLLMDRHPVTIDARAVERIDTAALQVLCAFVRDRKAAGGQVLWAGCTENFSEAIKLLGIQQALGLLDAQLTGVAA